MTDTDTATTPPAAPRITPCGELLSTSPEPRCYAHQAPPEHCDSCPDYTPGLNDIERTRCEVWTRVMGYHRPVHAFNPGKQAEHADRKMFKERGAPPTCP